MNPQLTAHSTLPPRARLLSELARADVPVDEVLCRLAALHQGSDVASLRHRELSTGGHLRPMSESVPRLVLFFLKSLEQQWGLCQEPWDDLVVAAYAVWAVNAICPFDNGNERAALDFAQWLLMRRWALDLPVMLLPDGIESLLAPPLSKLDPEVERTPEGMVQHEAELCERFMGTTVSRLRAAPSFDELAGLLAASLHPAIAGALGFTEET